MSVISSECSLVLSMKSNASVTRFFYIIFAQKYEEPKDCELYEM